MGLTKVTAKVRNTTSVYFKIQEGNAGLFVTKATLYPGKFFCLELDPNATYREYVLVKLPENTSLEPFSSDDVAEYKEIVIKAEQVGEQKTYCWEGIYRGQKPESSKTADPAVVDSTTVPRISWFQKFKNLF